MTDLINKYGIREVIEVPKYGALPVLDIPMMTDARWNELAAENAKRRAANCVLTGGRGTDFAG